MADNKQLPPTGTGTADIVVATDEIAGVDYQRIKLVDGTDGATTGAKVSAEGAIHVTKPTLQSSQTLTTTVNDAITVDVGAATEIAFVAQDTEGGSGTVVYEVTADGTTWRSALGWYDPDPIQNYPPEELNFSFMPTAGEYVGILTSGFRQVRVRVDATLTAPVDYEINAAALPRPVGSVRLYLSTSPVMGANPTADAKAPFGASVPTLAHGYVFNGTNWDRMRGDITNGLDVDVTRLPAIPAGTNAIGKLAANSGVDIGDVDVTSITTGPAPHANGVTMASVTAQYTGTQTSTILGPTNAAGVVMYVTSIQIQAGGTTAGTLQVYYGTGAYSRGTSRAIFDGEFAPSATLKPGYAQSPPIPFVSVAGDECRVTTSAAINPLTVTIWYYLV